MKQFRHYFTITKNNKITMEHTSFYNHNKAIFQLERIIEKLKEEEFATVINWKVWNNEEEAEITLKDINKNIITVKMMYLEGIA